MATRGRKPNAIVAKEIVKPSRVRGRAATTITTDENEIETVVAPPKKTVSKKKTPVKKTAAKKTTSAGGWERAKDPVTGFVPGSDSHKVAEALLAGGKDRGEINTKLKKILGKTTKSGTEKPIPAITAGVLGKLLAQGFTIESSFKVLPPTAASKRAATRKRNAAK